MQEVLKPAVPETVQPPCKLLPPDAFELRVLSISLHADSTKDSYKVSYREPGITRMMNKNISARDLMHFPGGSIAIDTYFNASSTKKPKKQNIKALCFDAVKDTYTVSFAEAGKGKKTERLMRTSELLKLPGGAFVIEEYKALYTPNLPVVLPKAKLKKLPPVVLPKAKKLPPPICNLPVTDLPYSACDLCVSSFQPITAQYTVQYRVPGSTTTLDCQVHADHLKKLPGGPEAILVYIKTHAYDHPVSGPEALLLPATPNQPQIISALNFNLITDSYTVKMIEHGEHGETKQIEKLMTTSELLHMPGGPSAIATYKRLLATMNVQVIPAKNLYILKFDKILKNYTVSYNEPGKRTKIEQMLSRSELEKMQGMLLV